MADGGGASSIPPTRRRREPEIIAPTFRHDACTSLRDRHLMRRVRIPKETMMQRTRFFPLLRLLTLALSLGAFSSAALAQRAESRQAKAQAEKADAPPAVVDLNKATEADLTNLPGIGPSKARAILELRTRLKGFSRVEDLLRVKGIGRKTFQKLRPMIRVGAK
jgi:competence protein ComEA